VDSSVGGKTGVNHPLGKNMIGAFYQPQAVIIDIDTLNTLPDRELSAGLAEVIKYGLIDDPEFFGWLEANMEALRQRQPEALAHAIERSCADKAAIVAPPRLGVDRFEALMAVDKKVQAGKLRLVLLRGIGSAVVTGDFSRETLRQLLEEETEPGE